jgi:hypothetical protein
MNEMFNERFSVFWDREPLMSSDDPNYSADSRYAFLRQTGVTHDARITLEMSTSKVPTSAEFDAIDWIEVRFTRGAPPGVQVTGINAPQPGLLAYYDFDNDGESDTVLKHGLTPGYGFSRTGGSEARRRRRHPRSARALRRRRRYSECGDRRCGFDLIKRNDAGMRRDALYVLSGTRSPSFVRSTSSGCATIRRWPFVPLCWDFE